MVNKNTNNITDCKNKIDQQHSVMANYQNFFNQSQQSNMQSFPLSQSYQQMQTIPNRQALNGKGTSNTNGNGTVRVFFGIVIIPVKLNVMKLLFFKCLFSFFLMKTFETNRLIDDQVC